MNSMSSLWEFLSQDTAFFGGPQSPMLSWLGSCGIVLFFVWQLIRLTVEVARARRSWRRRSRKVHESCPRGIYASHAPYGIRVHTY